MRCLLALLALLSGCHWVLPHRPVPLADGGAGDRASVDRADAVATDQPALPLDRAAWIDLTLKPDVLAPPDKLVPPDKVVPDKAVPDKAVPDKAIPSPDAKPTKLDGGACASWSGWGCPSSASFYCKASCGVVQIDCSATLCKCWNGSWKTCTNIPAGYCLGCQQAFESGCCN